MKDKTYAILLNWNSTEITTACLQSIYAAGKDAPHVVIVDSGSEETSLQSLKQWCLDQHDANDKQEPWFVIYSIDEAESGGVREREEAARRHVPRHITHPLILIECRANLGFAAGNNVGTRYALRKGDAQYIWTLNNDTTIEPGTLPELIRVLDSDPTIGAVQSLLLNFSDPGKVDSCGMRFYRSSSASDDLMGWNAKELLSRLKSPEPEIFGPCLASTLFAATIFETVGLLDDNYFCIFEAADFGFRLRMNGWHPRIATRAITYHKRGLSGTKGRPDDDFSDLWVFLKKRNAVALKIKFWPLSLLIWPPGFFVVAAKSVSHAIRRHALRRTLQVWTAAVKFRLQHRIDRTGLFDEWADRSLLMENDLTMHRN